MGIARQLRIAPWRSTDEDRLLQALAASVALHVCVAAFVNLSWSDSRPQGHSVLIVSLRPAVRSTAALQRDVARENELAAKSSGIPVARPVAVQAQLTAETALVARTGGDRQTPSPEAGGRHSQADATPSAGAASVRTGKPGELRALLLIAENGRAEQILWDKLPSMSDAQLVRIERHLRSRVYPGRSGQSIAETVDIVALFKADTAEDAARSDIP